MALRIFLGSLLVVLAIYTFVVVGEHGMGLLPIFFGDIASLTWPGQFNLDFFMMLLMSGLWTAWRSHFSSKGLLLAALAIGFGAGFLT
ncbi:MAG: hypothetical protein WA906_12960, partial [Pacificimonas sp.]